MGQLLRPWKTILSIILNSEKAVYRQIAEGIVEEIKRGRLRPGTPLPGTRQLAEDLRVNRKTIVLAYEDLAAEGWLTSTYRKGTFVSEKLPQKPAVLCDGKQGTTSSTFTFRSLKQESSPFIQQAKSTIVFDDGLPDVRLAPMNELVRGYKRIFQLEIPL